MNKLLRILAITLFFSTSLLSYSKNDIINSINFVSKKHGVSPKILFTIIKIESDFNPFAISFLTNEANAKYFKSIENKQFATISISNYSLNRSKWVVSIHPYTQAYATQIATMLYNDGFKIDVGLGQINAVNFTPNELNYIFNPVYNLSKCAIVLRRCFNFNKKNKKDLRDTIECYNYGMRNRPSDPYYRKFYKYYMQFFGDNSEFPQSNNTPVPQNQPMLQDNFDQQEFNDRYDPDSSLYE